MPSTSLTTDDLGTCTLFHIPATPLCAYMEMRHTPYNIFHCVTEYCLSISVFSQLVLLLWLCGWTGLGCPVRSSQAQEAPLPACSTETLPAVIPGKPHVAPRGKTGVWVGNQPKWGNWALFPHMHSHFLFQEIGIWVKNLCMECKEQSKR